MAFYTTGLVAAWDLTGQSVGVQTIAASHGTSYALTNGATTGVEGNDCAATAQGMLIGTAGADDFMHAPVLDSDVLGAVTVCIVCNTGTGIGHHFVGKNSSQTINIPVKFFHDGSALRLARANATGARIWSGPAIGNLVYRMYSVAATANIEDAPDFYVGDTKTAGTFVSGSQTGSPTGSSSNLRIGLAEDASAAASYTAAYVLVYNTKLTEAQIAQNYAQAYADLNTAPISLGLPAPTYSAPSTAAFYYALSQGLR
jgi:hypothetical protein